MTSATDIKHIVRDPDVYGGKPHIEGRRIAVHDIAMSRRQGYTPEEIAGELYPALALAEVYAALLYYSEHQDEIDREIAGEAAEIAARAHADTSPLAQRARLAIEGRKRSLNS